MDEEQGLAQQMMQGGGRGNGQGKYMEEIQQIVALLKQGMTPDELIQKGVPEELVMAALQMVEEESQVPDQNAGLASMVTKQI